MSTIQTRNNSGRVNSLHCLDSTSIPFYSGHYGYKMCLSLYILGDGIGKNTHMSLFFVVMKGEFDAILQWPFTHKVSFRLINQHHGRDIVDVFQPDPLSSATQDRHEHGQWVSLLHLLDILLKKTPSS